MCWNNFWGSGTFGCFATVSYLIKKIRRNLPSWLWQYLFSYNNDLFTTDTRKGSLKRLDCSFSIHPLIWLFLLPALVRSQGSRSCCDCSSCAPDWGSVTDCCFCSFPCFCSDSDFYSCFCYDFCSCSDCNCCSCRSSGSDSGWNYCSCSESWKKMD